MDDLSPLWISLKVAGVSLFFTFFTGVIAAWAVKGLKKGKNILDAVLSLPLVLPPTVLGFLLLVAFGKNSPLGRLLSDMDISVIFTFKGAVIASFLSSFPVMYKTVRGAFDQVDEELTDAAKTYGYGRAGILFKVMVPISWPGIISGAVLSFARSLGEFGATIMVAGNLKGKTRTMSIAVYTAVQAGDRELAFKWVIIILMISFIILFLMNTIMSRQYSTEGR
ncbi:MAG: molybdate ABC transporter permease subunit [Lachnospiraceae bacterium]|nr:molybdate ABC transporter permease subunit [Lachnospiraceae bacterium]